jgi:hypothetical protein
MAGSADSSPASRNERTAGSISYPRPVPETATRSPALAVSAHAERIPFPCRTTSTSSSSEPGLNRSGVSVRIVGRLPSANRNSFPAHVGRTTSVGSPGSRTRTLAAGSPGSNPWSIGPARVIRTIWGLRGSIRATSTMRNGGGSLRARIALTTAHRFRTRRARSRQARSRQARQTPSGTSSTRAQFVAATINDDFQFRPGGVDRQVDRSGAAVRPDQRPPHIRRQPGDPDRRAGSGHR